MNPPATSRLSARPPVVIGAAVVLLGWMAVAAWPRLLLAVGIFDYGRWFLDSYAVLAASDAVRLGIDPTGPNPLDPLLRDHKYSDWWYALRWLGLTRAENWLVGLAWVASFATTAWWTARPRDYRETAWLSVFLLSPPVLLAVSRANNDLVIFVLLALAGVAASAAGRGRQLLAGALLAVATGLKFYPVVAAGALLWVKPARRLVALLFAAAACGAVLLSVWPQMARGQFQVDLGIHTLGAVILGRDLGLADLVTRLLALVVLAAGGALFAAGRFTTGLASRGEERLRLLAAMGLLVLLACFVAGMNYAYRWIFAIWMGLWLWREARATDLPPRARRTALAGLVLLAACLWLDGLLGFVANSFLPKLEPETVTTLQYRWRLVTQPFHWLLMMLFAGWLLEAGPVLLREWREARKGA